MDLGGRISFAASARDQITATAPPTPEHRRYLVEDRSRIPAATEELLRYYAPALLGRVVTTDMELGGKLGGHNMEAGLAAGAEMWMNNQWSNQAQSRPQGPCPASLSYQERAVRDGMVR